MSASSYVGDDGPSLYTAVQQLGLKLVPTKGPLEGIVIDHVGAGGELDLRALDGSDQDALVVSYIGRLGYETWSKHSKQF